MLEHEAAVHSAAESAWLASLQLPVTWNIAGKICCGSGAVGSVPAAVRAGARLPAWRTAQLPAAAIHHRAQPGRPVSQPVTAADQRSPLGEQQGNVTTPGEH